MPPRGLGHNNIITIEPYGRNFSGAERRMSNIETRVDKVNVLFSAANETTFSAEKRKMKKVKW